MAKRRPSKKARAEAAQDLSAAIVARDLDGVRAALAKGADPSSLATTTPKGIYRDDVPCVVAAAVTGQVEIVRALLDAGASIDGQAATWRCYPFSDEDVEFPAETALCIAAEEGYLDIVELLLERGAHPDLGDALCLAAKGGDLSIVKAMVLAGSTVNQSDGDYHSPLHYAASGGHLPMVVWLFDQGAHFTRQIDLRDARKRTKRRGHPEVVQWLDEQSDRYLLGRQTSFWRTDLGLEQMAEAYRELLSAVAGERLEWGEVTFTDDRTEKNWGSTTGHRNRRTEQQLGPHNVIRLRVDTLPDTSKPEQVKDREDAYLVGDGPFVLSSEERLDRGQEPLVLLQKTADASGLDAFDAMLPELDLSFEVKWVGDGDSEYQVRRRLEGKK